MRIPLPEPFDFDLTVGHQTHYRGRAGADLYDDGTYYRVLWRADRLLAAAATPTGDGSLDVTLLNGGLPDDEAFAGERMAELLGLDVDLGGFYGVLERDTVLAATVGNLRGLRPTRAESMFEALVQSIVAQQISGVVARVIRDGLVRELGVSIAVGGHDLFAFPSPEAVLAAGIDGLKQLKLSARKAEYIHGIARDTLEGELDPDRLSTMGDEEAIAELVGLRGVGRWTAEWVLMRALGRLDVLPAGDLALRRTVSDLYFDGAGISIEGLAEFAQRWSPYRGLATTYLFAHLRRLRAGVA